MIYLSVTVIIWIFILFFIVPIYCLWDVENIKTALIINSDSSFNSFCDLRDLSRSEPNKQLIPNESRYIEFF